MRALLAALLLLPAIARADPSPSDAAAIHGTITGQIDAFRRDDGPGAFGFASPNLQAMFGTAEHFMAMVQRGYAPVYRPRSVDFTSLGEEDGTVVQLVELIGPDGVGYTARYTMEREADGSWRISGCQLLQSLRVGT